MTKCPRNSLCGWNLTLKYKRAKAYTNEPLYPNKYPKKQNSPNLFGKKYIGKGRWRGFCKAFWAL